MIPDGQLDTIPDDLTMYALGFTDRRPGDWYFTRHCGHDISLNVTIDKATLNWSEVVIDEVFGQTYHYGHYPLADGIAAAVDQTVRALNEAGVDIRVDHAAYGHNPKEDQ